MKRKRGCPAAIGGAAFFDRRGRGKGKVGTDPILFGMDIPVSYSVMKPVRRIDAL
jgi:hypothetical protein